MLLARHIHDADVAGLVPGEGAGLFEEGEESVDEEHVGEVVDGEAEGAEEGDWAMG